MAEIRFREIQDLLGEDLDNGEGLHYEEKIIDSLSIDSDVSEEAIEIILGISELMSEETSVAFCYLDRVLYARIFDGERYVFPLPFMLDDECNAEGACINLAAYSRRELVPLIISDVPRDELEFLCSIFSHIDAFCYEDDDDSFFVKVNNECDMLEEIPTVELDGITLDELCDDDKEKYAELCRDRNLNKYWGYDADVDNPDGNADFYLNVVRREMDDGVALTLAARENGALVGEATLYDFDYRGGASIAVRVLPSYHSRGIGSRTLKALIELAREIGLTEIRTEVLIENENSIKMTSKYMNEIMRTESKVLFALSL